MNRSDTASQVFAVSCLPGGLLEFWGAPLHSPSLTAPSAPQVRLGPRTNTEWFTQTTSAWSWKRSSTTAGTSPSDASPSWLLTWGSQSGRYVGPPPQLKEQGPESGFQDVMKIQGSQKEDREIVSPTSGTVLHSACCHTANKAQHCYTCVCVCTYIHTHIHTQATMTTISAIQCSSDPDKG